MIQSSGVVPSCGLTHFKFKERHTCLRHLVFLFKMCRQISFWTRGWEVRSNWVKKLKLNP